MHRSTIKYKRLQVVDRELRFKHTPENLRPALLPLLALLGGGACHRVSDPPTDVCDAGFTRSIPLTHNTMIAHSTLSPHTTPHLNSLSFQHARFDGVLRWCTSSIAHNRTLSARNGSTCLLHSPSLQCSNTGPCRCMWGVRGLTLPRPRLNHPRSVSR